MKIEYGISNVHIAKRTIDEQGKVIYDTPKSWKGAVSTDLAPQGESTPVYADNIVFEEIDSNQGYNGDIVFTSVPDWFLEEFLGMKRDSNNILVEDSGAKSTEFALSFQFENDVKATRHLFYKCKATRPNLSSKTKENSITPNENKVTISALPDPDVMSGKNIVKTKTSEETATSVYDNWYKSVYIPTFEVSQPESNPTL